MKREQLLERLRAERFDLLVIGGGATGCGAALDAATRGLRTALVEREDFGCGTSSRSTKLIHGGVRYLELAVRHLDRRQFRLVKEALHERQVLLRIAPHLTRRLPLFTPLYQAWQVPYYWIGLKIYDALAGKSGIGSSRWVSRSEARRRYPQLSPNGLLGGMLYVDGQFDDARMNVALALTAIGQGAAAVNYVEVTGLIRRDGRVCGAEVRDHIGNREFEVRARVVVNAAGPWADQVRRLEDPGAASILEISSGAHLVVDGSYGLSETGILIPRTEDGRVLFILPWLGHCLIGTTEESASEVSPRPSEETIEYLLRHANRYLARPVDRSAIKSAWAGLRPLLRAEGTGGTAALARDHVVLEGPEGLLTITGGKWTTYRRMAQATVDIAVRRAGLPGAQPCSTESLSLVGGRCYGHGGTERLREEFGLDPDLASHLDRAYGDRAAQVAELASQGLGARLAPGHAFLEAEAVWAAREELAQTAMDVLARRTRLAFLDVHAAKAAVPTVVRLLARELGWDAHRQASEMRAAAGRLESGL